MAKFKKNALNQITFTVVDKTDFATIESAITASDFDSGMTKRGFGYNHGGSAATTSFAISKAVSLVRSGIMRQTLKATECNYDRVHYTFRGHASCADQHIIIDFMDSDDSDLTSQLTIIQSMASDAASAAQQANSRVLLNQSRISDLQSLLSDVYSDLLSLIGTTGVQLNASMLSDLRSAIAAGPAGVLTTSDISDVASAVRAVMVSDLSDTLSAARQAASRALIIQSTISDLQSTLSDFRSATATAPQIASRVWSNAIGARVDSRILIVQSQASDIDSALTSRFSNLESLIGTTGVAITASSISDLASAVRAILLSDISDIHSSLSDIKSRVTTGVPLDASTMSDIRSAIAAGPAATVTASDISDIASAVRAMIASDLSDILSAAVQGNSRALLNQSRISDVYSLLSDAYSDLKSQLSDVHSDIKSDLSNLLSDMGSKIGGIAAVITSSDISDIASAVRALIASDLSDIYSAVSDARSMLVAGVSIGASDMSDLRSAIAAGPAATVTASDISDIASAVRALLASDLSDILSAAVQGNSRALLNQSRISDVYSLLSDMNSDVQSDLSSIQSDLDNLQTRTLTVATTAKLEKSAGTIVLGTIDIAGFSPTVTQFEADDITEATASHYVGRIIIFTSGVLVNQATSISAYSLTGGRGHFTVAAMTEPPGDNDEFVIV